MSHHPKTALKKKHINLFVIIDGINSHNYIQTHTNTHTNNKQYNKPYYPNGEILQFCVIE